MIRQIQEEETHPLLPSGEWEGFYCYHFSSEQHSMYIELMFSDLVVSGSGVDDIALFTWTGKYDLEKFKIEMTKHYSTHKVWYKGDIDENGIWGIWKTGFLNGGFHIWPKKSKKETNSNASEEQAESEKLKKLFTEIFA